MIELNDDEQKMVLLLQKGTQWRAGESKMHSISDNLMTRIIEEQKAKIEKEK